MDPAPADLDGHGPAVRLGRVPSGVWTWIVESAAPLIGTLTTEDGRVLNLLGDPLGWPGGTPRELTRSVVVQLDGEDLRCTFRRVTDPAEANGTETVQIVPESLWGIEDAIRKWA